MKYRQFTKKENDWLDQFEKLMKKAPKSLFLYVGVCVAVYAKDENGNRYMTPGGGVDQDAAGRHIDTPMEYDGGDY